jgi:ribosomal protein S12 methylthiotransferase
LPEVNLFVEPADIPDLPRLLDNALCKRITASAKIKGGVTLQNPPIPPFNKGGLGGIFQAARSFNSDKILCNRYIKRTSQDGRKPTEAEGHGRLMQIPRILTTPGYAYLKIAEGCSRCCRFCTIPSIRGPLTSFDPDELEQEARLLASLGVRELILVAQDLTSYGTDRGEKRALIRLLQRISQVEEIKWIRLMYLHPNGIRRNLVDIINQSANILPYLDIPFQHVSDTVLRAMGRPWKGDRIRTLVDQLRRDIDGLVLRTTLMIGYPAEGEKEYAELKRFVESFAIERIGIFTYSPEEGTRAMRLGDPVPREVKEARADEILGIQARFMEQRNRRRVGNVEPCLVEGPSQETALLLQARTWDQAPEVDGTLYITAGQAVQGEIHAARITGCHGPDLFGELMPLTIPRPEAS